MFVDIGSRVFEAKICFICKFAFTTLFFITGSQSDMALSVDSSTRTNVPHESILEKLLRLARDVSKTQGIYASTATRMHHSAETVRAFHSFNELCD